MTPKSIAFISTMEATAWGGSEELWSLTAHLLLKQGHTVLANVRWWPEIPWQLKKLQEAGCQVKRRHSGGIAKRAARRAVTEIVGHLGVSTKSWLDETKPDFVVISQGDPYTGAVWAEQCRRRQIPYACVVHAAAEQWWPDDAEAARAALSYEAAAANYFVSQGNLELVRTQLATPLADAKVVRNPFSVSYGAILDWPEEDKDDKTVRLACVGRLDPAAKGQDLLFEVLKEDKWKQRPLEVSLFGNGQNGDTLMKLKEWYGLNNVFFRGFTNSIESIWKTHHALVLPSRYEGLPITIVEAMLCGRPAIVTNVAGNAELLEDNITGFVAAAPTKWHLDEALERVWAQRSHLQQMGQLAGERIRQQVPADPIAAFSAELQQSIK